MDHSPPPPPPSPNRRWSGDVPTLAQHEPRPLLPALHPGKSSYFLGLKMEGVRPPPLRSLDDFLLSSARFALPDVRDLDRWNNRIINNLLYYQSNYFLSALGLLLLVGWVVLFWRVPLLPLLPLSPPVPPSRAVSQSQHTGSTYQTSLTVWHITEVYLPDEDQTDFSSLYRSVGNRGRLQILIMCFHCRSEDLSLQGTPAVITAILNSVDHFKC